MKRYTFRQSNFSDFFNSPSLFLKRYLDKDSFKPNEAMLFGTAQHKLREEKNGKHGEVPILIDFEGSDITGHLDYYDGKKIIDYKFTQNTDKYTAYKFQISFYQWLVWQKDAVLVPATLEMNEVLQTFDKYETTGRIKRWEFKVPEISDLKKFTKRISDAKRKMIYLIERKEKQAKMKKSIREDFKEEIAETQKEIKEGKFVGVNRGKSNKK